MGCGAGWDVTGQDEMVFILDECRARVPSHDLIRRDCRDEIRGIDISARWGCNPVPLLEETTGRDGNPMSARDRSVIPHYTLAMTVSDVGICAGSYTTIVKVLLHLVFAFK